MRRRRIEVAFWLLGGLVAATVGVAGTAGSHARLIAAGATVACCVVALWRRPQRDPDRWRRGAAGEEATAAVLDRLSPRRWAVLHDRRVPGSRANVDHLVIGRRGVWVLDSKAYRVPVRAGWRSVRVGEHRLDTGPVSWEASVVADRLGVDVRPLVVVHGVGLPRRGRRCDGVLVLPAETLISHLRRGRRTGRLDRETVSELAELAAVALPEA